MIEPRHSPEDFSEAWHHALDELELEVDRAEDLLRAEHTRTDSSRADLVAGLGATTTWVPPVIRSPLPDSVRERAERILERQLTVVGRLSTAMTSSRKHLDVVERLVPSDARPMYVDQAL